MPDKSDDPKRKQSGIALETDVLKKMAHQLARLPDRAAKVRAAQYIARIAVEERDATVAAMAKNGQATLPVAAAGQDVFEVPGE